MISILDIQKKYSHKIDSLDLELIIAHALQKPREFVLSHPEKTINNIQRSKINKLIKRRLKNEPIAYILGEKEFYGLNFKVTKDTLIPRPETELLVEKTLHYISTLSTNTTFSMTIIDVGTGSGNIIISIAKNNEQRTVNNKKIKYFATDISTKALYIAKKNSRIHKVNNPLAGGIKFIKSDLLNYFLDHCSLITDYCVIVANLPYLSQKIYSAVSPDIKNFEPKSALLSKNNGLDHYEKLLKQIKRLQKSYRLPTCNALHDTAGRSLVACFLEFSPEQKAPLVKLVGKYFPKAKCFFSKDLAGKWRLCSFEI